MIDIATHTFKTTTGGLVGLIILSILLAMPFPLLLCFFWDELTHSAEGVVYLFLSIGVIIYTLIILCRVWRLFIVAMQTTFIIDMKAFTMSYHRKNQSVTFKSSDIAHWYWLYAFMDVRDAQSPAYIILKSGEILCLHPWLMDSAPNDGGNVIYYIAHHPELQFPAPEKVPFWLNLTHKNIL